MCPFKAAIAKETGGKVYERNTSEVQTVIETEIKVLTILFNSFSFFH